MVKMHRLFAISLILCFAASAPALAKPTLGARFRPMPPPNPGWTTTATAHRGHNGRIVRFHCPANGRLGSVWGTGLYTDDSSVCTAAVHAGVITRARGGAVRIEIRPGAPGYAASSHNGVTSGRWGRWSGSFVILGGKLAPPPLRPNRPGQITWSANATSHRARPGSVVTVWCPAHGRLTAPVWGDGVYTDDSAICVAAVHAGRITAAAGGAVTIEILPGQTGYPAATHHGVQSRRWGKWRGSFVFVN